MQRHITMHKRDKLNTFKDNEGFKVPDNYFETLDSRIMDAIPKNSFNDTIGKTETIGQPNLLWSRLKPISYIAAMLIGAVLIVRALLISGPEEPNLFANNFDLDQVSDEFIQETMVGAVLDEYTMYEFLTENLDYDEE